MRRLALIVVFALVAIPAVAQVTPRGTSANPSLGIPKVINVTDQPYGAVATLATFQTTALQSAITAACALSSPGIVFIPGGNYAFSTLSIPCSGLTLRGVNNAGISGVGTQLLQSGSGATVMLTVGTSGTPVKDVTIEDILFSGAGDANNIGGIDLTCANCHLNRVAVEGYNVFAFRFLGLASTGSGGWSTITDCIVQTGAANSFAFVIVTQTGTTGGPDGNVISHCYVNTNNGWINDSTVAGATALRSSQSFIGNRFEAAQNGTPVIAWQGQSDADRVIGNRFENTGTGGITVTPNNVLVTDPPAFFEGNLWACGSGLCTWTDNATVKSVRIGEAFGPSNNARPPGVLVNDATATTSGAGSPVTLKSYTLPANSVNSSGSTMLHIRAWGHTANNANAKTASVVFGGVTLITITETISAADQWACDLTVAFRTTGSAAQSVGGDCSQGATGTVATPVSATPTLDFTVSNTVAISVTQVAAADMVQDGMIVTLCGAVGAAGC